MSSYRRQIDEEEEEEDEEVTQLGVSFLPILCLLLLFGMVAGLYFLGGFGFLRVWNRVESANDRLKIIENKTHGIYQDCNLQCDLRRELPSGLSGFQLFETPLGDFHISMGRVHFPGSGRTCYYGSTIPGNVYRRCDDNANNTELWIDLTGVVESGLEQEGLIGFQVSADGTRAYTHYYTDTSDQFRPPPYTGELDQPERSLALQCNRTILFPPNDEWKSLPSAGRVQVVEWDLQGINDQPANPFTLLAYDAFGLEHNGVDTLRLLPKDQNILLIGMGDQQQFWEQGRYNGPDQFNSKVWAMDLENRRKSPSMNGPAPRQLSQLPQGVVESLTLVMDGVRQPNAPAVDHDVYKDGDPLLWQWMMGAESGEPIYALKGLVGDRPRHTGWPIYSGLGYTTYPIVWFCESFDPQPPLLAGFSELSKEEENLLKHWTFGRRNVFPSASSNSKRTNNEIKNETFVPEWLHVIIYANEYLEMENRYLPVGFATGSAASDSGPNMPRGATTGHIGSGLIRLNPGECPVGVTGSFRDIFTFKDGSLTPFSPYIEEKYGLIASVPRLSLWMPDWSKPERQAKTYLYELADVLIDRLLLDGDNTAYIMTSLSSSPEHDRLYASFISFPGQGAPNCQTWVIQINQ